MKTSNDYETIITHEYLLNNNPINLNIKIPKSNKRLAKGKLLDTNNKPIANACIEVNCICKVSNKQTFLGCTYTDEQGNYAFTFDASIQYDYLLTIYNSISK